MREIKFRAFIQPLNTMITVNKLTISGSDVAVWVNDTFYFDGLDTNLMQYTGLKDLEGNEVYEGDILEVEMAGSIYKGVVEYDPMSACFVLRREGKTATLNAFTTSPVASIKVIGNIYQNPYKDL